MSKVTDAHVSKATKEVQAHFATASASSFFVTFFVNFILPILPSLLMSAAPQLQTPKAQAILKAADQVLDQLIGETP